MQKSLGGNFKVININKSNPDDQPTKGASAVP